MLHIIQPVPKTIPIIGNTYLFGTEWLVTISDTQNLLDIACWCYENHGMKTIIYYYKHGTDRWLPMDVSKATMGYINNIHDSMRVRFKDEEDVMAFKLTWME